MPVITILERLRQEDYREFEAGQRYMAGSYLGREKNSSFPLLKKKRSD